MSQETWKKILFGAVVASLMVMSFLTCLANFQKSNKKFCTIDENVYSSIAVQVLTQGLDQYNAIWYGQSLMSRGWPKIPAYFFKPLFKHPPVFPFFLAGSMSLWGKTMEGEYYVPLLFGVLLIPLTYMMGRHLFNRTTGLLAAFFLYIDPIRIICSQKIWMETTLSFFTVVSIFLFVLAVKEKKGYFFILSGFFCSLAALTKYPGFLPVLIYILYAGIYERSLFKKTSFRGALLLPFLMSIPWIVWNFDVYGVDFLKKETLVLHSAAYPEHLPSIALKVSVLVGFATLVAGFYFFVSRKKSPQNSSSAAKGKKMVRLLTAIALCLLLREYLLRGAQIDFRPVSSWVTGFFAGEPFYFYFGRLLEFSLVYALAYGMFFVDDKRLRRAGSRIVKLAIVIIFGFYILWGNYQSRYILAAIPFLLVLAGQGIVLIWEWIWERESLLRRNLFLVMLLLIMLHFVFKANYINHVLSFPNNVCYF